MKFLFASGLPHIPQAMGGSQSSTHDLALDLIARGHEAAVLAPLAPTGYVGIRSRVLMKLLRTTTSRDDFLGYPVYRRWHVDSELDSLIADICPDVAIVQAMHPVPIAKELIRLSVPTIVYLRDVEFQLLGGDPSDLEAARMVSNSEFTARRYKEVYGIDAAVIPPLFRPEHYRTRSSGSNITFVNPFPDKGSELAFEIARRCPEIPFCFVEAWTLTNAQRAVTLEKMKTAPNVTLRRRTQNIRSVYARAKIVLMPSKWEEAWGRVATEAHFSGIPVVASNRGGLPELVGPGGVLLDPDGPVEQWVEAVRRLWTDEAYYKEKSAAALAYAKRPEIDRVLQIEKLLDVAREAIEKNRGADRSVA